jgi:hypothetical protein
LRSTDPFFASGCHVIRQRLHLANVLSNGEIAFSGGR